MNAPVHSQFSPARFTVGLVLVLVIGLQFSALLGEAKDVDALKTSINNCRMIITAMRIYAADAQGVYPDTNVPGAKTSNEAFRDLFRKGACDNETPFGCANSPFKPDGNIGKVAEGCLQALEPGENHWAMTKGMNDSTSGSVALVFENPTDVAWPPGWNADAAGQSVKGRSWEEGKIIVGCNDGSVELRLLSTTKGTRVSFASDEAPFPKHEPGVAYKVLDVAVKK